MHHVLADIRDGLARWELWTALAWDDIRYTHRRTVLGAAWYAVSFMVLIGVKLVIFGTINPARFDVFAVYLATGFLAWDFLSSIAIEGCTVFTGSTNWISGVRLPYSVFVFRSLARILIQFCFKLVPVALLCLALGHGIGPSALMIVPAFIVVLAAGVFVQLFLGSLCVRFRDVQHLVTSTIRIFFFLSPIVWTIDQLGDIGRWVRLNPFYHLIEILRAPVFTGTVPAESWLFVAVFTALIVPAGLAVFAATRQKIPFWL